MGVDMTQWGRRLGLGITGAGGGHGGLLAGHGGDGLGHCRRHSHGGGRGGQTGTLESSLLQLGQLLIGVVLAGVLLEEIKSLGATETRRASTWQTSPGKVLWAGKTREG